MHPPVPSLPSAPLMAWRGWKAVWTGAEGETERELDVSATCLEQTVRVPPDGWPDSLLLTVMGVESGALASDLLDEVRTSAIPIQTFVM